MPEPTGDGGDVLYETSFDPTAKRDSRLGPTFTIKEIYPLVMLERPETLDRAKEGWDAYDKALGGLITDIDTHYGTLKPTWTSDASSIFFNKIDTSRKSVAEWQYAAQQNSKALKALADEIRAVQGIMEQLWTDFTQKIKDAGPVDHGGWHDFWFGVDNRLDPIVEDFTNQTNSKVVNRLNQAYRDAFISSLPGSQFNGPTNAQSPTKEQWQDALGGPPGVGPGAAPGRPSAPGRPGAPAGLRTNKPAPPTPPPAPLGNNKPNAPLPPTRPKQPQALQQQRPEPPPRPGQPPAQLPSGQRPGAPGALPNGSTEAPTAPGGLPVGLAGLPPGGAPAGLGKGPAGAPPPPVGLRGPGAPGGGRTGAPEMPNGLQGRGSGPGSPQSGMGEPPPGSGMRNPPPQLPGRGNGPRDGKPQQPRPGTPGAEGSEPPPPGRGMPPLSGRNGKQAKSLDEADATRARPPGGGPPGPGRFGSPKSLQGIRDPRPRVGPGSMEAEEISARQVPTLTGRLGPVEAEESQVESTLQALREGLGGRGTLAPSGSNATRDDERAPAETAEPVAAKNPTVDFVGDANLFTPEEAAPPVIRLAAEPEAVVREEPALRPTRTDQTPA